MTTVTADLGKYRTVPNDVNFGRNKYDKDDIVLVLEHKVDAGNSRNNTTTLAVFDPASFSAAKNDASIKSFDDLKAKAKFVAADVTNQGLAKVFGTGVWQLLFSAPLAFISFDQSATAPDVSQFVGQTLRCSAPVESNGAFAVITADWTVIADAAAGSTMCPAACHALPPKIATG